MTTTGIDVSRWNGAFDWKAHPGLSFGMAKACEGTGETDSEFGHNWDSMWWYRDDHRMPRFAYLFFHASQDPEEQAGHLVRTVRGHGLLPGDNFVLDCEETIPGSGENDGIPALRCAPLAVRCLERINALAPGHRVLPYMNPSWARQGGSMHMGSWSLWLADYGTAQPDVPDPWHQWTFWQSGDSPVDRDQFNGSLAQLLTFTRMPAERR